MDANNLKGRRALHQRKRTYSIDPDWKIVDLKTDLRKLSNIFHEDFTVGERLSYLTYMPCHTYAHPPKFLCTKCHYHFGETIADGQSLWPSQSRCQKRYIILGNRRNSEVLANSEPEQSLSTFRTYITNFSLALKPFKAQWSIEPLCKRHDTKPAFITVTRTRRIKIIKKKKIIRTSTFHKIQQYSIQN